MRSEGVLPHSIDDYSRRESMHPAWRAFMKHCRELYHGEITRLVIQDGIPVFAEETRKKVKFT